MKTAKSVLMAGGLVGWLLSGLYPHNILANPQDSGTNPDRTEMAGFLERFHGHTCPGSLMGLRLGMAAKDALKGHGKLKAKCFVLSCPDDGIQVGAGTTYGNKALDVEDRNELYLILTDVPSGRQVEARLTKKAEEMGKTYRDLSSKGRALAPGSPEQLKIEQEKNAVLSWFRAAPDVEVVTIRTLGK